MSAKNNLSFEQYQQKRAAFCCSLLLFVIYRMVMIYGSKQQ